MSELDSTTLNSTTKTARARYTPGASASVMPNSKNAVASNSDVWNVSDAEWNSDAPEKQCPHLNLEITAPLELTFLLKQGALQDLQIAPFDEYNLEVTCKDCDEWVDSTNELCAALLKKVWQPLINAGKDLNTKSVTVTEVSKR